MMPTSSGHDRANYSTTFGFSRGAYARVNKNRYANLYDNESNSSNNNNNNNNNNNTNSKMSTINNGNNKKNSKYNNNTKTTPPKMTSTTLRKSRERSNERSQLLSGRPQQNQPQMPIQPPAQQHQFDPPKTINHQKEKPIKRNGFNSNNNSNNNFYEDSTVHPAENVRGTSIYYRDTVENNMHRQHQQLPPLPPDQTYVKIQDPNLREIVQELVKSEQETNNEDPNLITQIDHKGYSLFLSKNGLNPFKAIEMASTNTTRRSRFPSENNPFINDSTNSHSISMSRNQPIPIPILKKQQQALPSNSRNLYRRSSESPGILHYEYQDTNGDNYEIRELNSRNAELSSRLHLDNMTDIPVEVTRLIQQDMSQNPLGDEERNYRIIINRQTTKPGQAPQAVRVKARNLNGKKILEYLPEIEGESIRQVPIQYATATTAANATVQTSTAVALTQPPTSHQQQHQHQHIHHQQQQQQYITQQQQQQQHQLQAFNPTSPQYVIKPTNYQDAKYLPTAQGNQQTFFYNEANGPVAIRPISPGHLSSGPINNFTGYSTNQNYPLPPQNQYSTATYVQNPQQIIKPKPKQQYFGNVNED